MLLFHTPFKTNKVFFVNCLIKINNKIIEIKSVTELKVVKAKKKTALFSKMAKQLIMNGKFNKLAAIYIIAFVTSDNVVRYTTPTEPEVKLCT